MLRQEVLDRIADGEARLVVPAAGRGLAGIGIGARRPLTLGLLRARGQHRLGAPAREERRKRLRVLLLEPLRRLRGIRKLSGNPGRGLVDAGVLDVLPAGAPLADALRLLLRDALQLVGVLDVGRDLALLQRLRDGLDHHRIGLVARHDQYFLALSQNAEALALQAGLVPGEQPGRRHQLIGGFRRLEIGRPARRRVFLAVGADLGAGRGAGFRRCGRPLAARADGRGRRAHTEHPPARRRESLHHVPCSFTASCREPASPADIGLTFGRRDVTQPAGVGQPAPARLRKSSKVRPLSF